MTPSQTTDLKDFEKDELLFNPVLEESVNKPDETDTISDYSEKEEVIVNPNGDSDKKPEGFYISTKFIKIGGAVLAAIVALSAGIAMLNNKDKKSGPQPTETYESIYEEEPTNLSEAVIATSPSETTLTISSETTSSITSETISNTIDYSKPPKDVVEGYAFENLTAEQQEKIKKLDAMSVEEVWALPETEQLAFGWYVYTNNLPRFEYMKDMHGIDLEYVENPSTAEEYANNNAYMLCFISTCMRAYDKDTGSVTYDYDTAYKLAILSYSSTQNHHDAWKALCDAVVDSGSMVELRPTVEAYKKMDNGMIVNIYMTSNETITVPADSEHIQQTYQPVIFNNIIDGTEQKISYCIQTISQSDLKAKTLTSD